jgi:hypothetical protein
LDLSFYEDSYKLVEAPYLGMSIKVLLPMETFKNGYRGRDLSATGWGLSLILLLFMSLDTNGLPIILPIKICGYVDS